MLVVVAGTYLTPSECVLEKASLQNRKDGAVSAFSADYKHRFSKCPVFLQSGFHERDSMEFAGVLFALQLVCWEAENV